MPSAAPRWPLPAVLLWRRRAPRTARTASLLQQASAIKYVSNMLELALVRLVVCPFRERRRVALVEAARLVSTHRAHTHRLHRQARRSRRRIRAQARAPLRAPWPLSRVQGIRNEERGPIRPLLRSRDPIGPGWQTPPRHRPRGPGRSGRTARESGDECMSSAPNVVACGALCAEGDQSATRHRLPWLSVHYIQLFTPQPRPPSGRGLSGTRPLLLPLTWPPAPRPPAAPRAARRSRARPVRALAGTRGPAASRLGRASRRRGCGRRARTAAWPGVMSAARCPRSCRADEVSEVWGVTRFGIFFQLDGRVGGVRGRAAGRRPRCLQRREPLHISAHS